MLAHPPPRLTRRALCALLPLCALCALSCADSAPPIETEPLPDVLITLRVENASQFDYEALYAHSAPELNLNTAHKLTARPIESQTFTQIQWPPGFYLTAVRPLVVRGPLVAIRSRAPLSPREDQRTLRLLDEGFVLSGEGEL